MADGDGTEALSASPYATPWLAVPGKGIGAVRCPRCRRAVAEAAPGEHACRCGEAEEGCSRSAKLRARLDGVAAEVDDIVARAARLQVERDAALMALVEEQEMGRRELAELERDCRSERVASLMVDYRAEARALDDENRAMKAELERALARVKGLEKAQAEIGALLSTVGYQAQDAETAFGELLACRGELKRMRFLYERKTPGETTP